MSTTNILDLNNRIDELANSYPAAKVMLSDGVTSVEDAVDGLTANTFGTKQTLTINTNYTTAKDGYFKGTIDASSPADSKYMQMYVNSETFSTLANSTGFYQESTIFVRKGSVIKFGGSDGFAHGYFYPLQ